MTDVKKIALIPFIAFGIISCNHDPDTNLQVSEKGDNNVLEVIDLVKNFEKAAQTKSGNNYTDNEEIVVNSWKKTTYTFPVAANPVIKTLSSDAPDSTNVDLYFVTFNKGNHEGYSIACSDDRINRIYAYTEAGHISDTTNNMALARIIELIPNIVKQDLQKYYSSESLTKAASTYINYGPYLRTLWYQGPPFNNLLPLCNKGKEWLKGHVPAGCVAIATAQVIAYYQKFKGSYYGNANIDFNNLTWPGIIDDDDIFETRKMQAARFVKEVGTFCQIRYNCEDDKVSGSSQIASAALYLTDQGYSCRVVKDANIDLYQLYLNLSKKNVHLTGGNQKLKHSPGHAWVWDGIRGNLSGTTLTNVLLHCNWGNGTLEGRYDQDWSNGWFASYEQPVPSEPPFLDNNQQCYITNYK